MIDSCVLRYNNDFYHISSPSSSLTEAYQCWNLTAYRWVRHDDNATGQFTCCTSNWLISNRRSTSVPITQHLWLHSSVDNFSEMVTCNRSWAFGEESKRDWWGMFSRWVLLASAVPLELSWCQGFMCYKYERIFDVKVVWQWRTATCPAMAKKGSYEGPIKAEMITNRAGYHLSCRRLLFHPLFLLRIYPNLMDGPKPQLF